MFVAHLGSEQAVLLMGRPGNHFLKSSAVGSAKLAACACGSTCSSGGGAIPRHLSLDTATMLCPLCAVVLMAAHLPRWSGDSGRVHSCSAVAVTYLLLRPAQEE